MKNFYNAYHYILCVQEINQKLVEVLNVMEKEEMKNDPDEQVNQGHHIYIELWFLTITKWSTTLFNSVWHHQIQRS